MQLKLKTFRLAIWLLLMLGFNSFIIAQSTNLLDSTVKLNIDNKSIIEILETIEEQTTCSFYYNPSDLNIEKKYSFDKEELSIKAVLKNLFPNDEIKIQTKGNRIILKKKKAFKEKQVVKKRVTLNGYFMDVESKETLIGATVLVKELKKGAVSNEYGFYSISLPAGTYEIIFSYVGYQPLAKQITLEEDLEFSPMMSINNTLEEVIVTDEKSTLRHVESKMSSNKISMAKVKAIPALMGERDVLKVIQLMPGVQSGSEGTTGLYVRGGGPDQNLMLLDGVPVYNASHLFGFLSTFNGDAIKSVELIKGGFPSRYGGRLSSIIDVRMKEGNMNKIHGDLTIGLISGRFNIEGPIVKDKTSFSISGRRTWFDLIASPAQKISNKSKEAFELKTFVKYNLYDLNAKVNHKFSNKSRLYLSSYLGNDKLIGNNEDALIRDNGTMDWGNKIVTGRWNYQLSPKLFSNTTVYLSSYDFNFENETTEFAETSNEIKDLYTSNSNIKDYGAKLDFNYLPHPNHHIRTGIKYGIYEFTPTTSFRKFKDGENPEITTINTSPKITGSELSFYLEDDMILTSRLKVNAGVHVANFAVETSNYTSVQPRASLSFLMTEKSSLKFSATKMTQFLHLLASPGLGLPTDLWVSSTDKIKPENAWQYGVGYTQSLANGYELTLEGFYKDMDNLLEYKSGFNIFSNSKDWEEKVDIGEGTSFGGEILFEKTKGKTTGWIGYTLSKSTRKFPNINYGNSFPYKYDRRHDISVAVTHKKSRRVDFGLVWVYGTGNTFTLGTTNYNALGIYTEPDRQGTLFGSISTTNHIESRNNQRMPAYHRLDLSVNLHKEKKNGTRTWSFGIYNAYGRQNPFVVYNTLDRDGVPILKQQSLLPILPYFSYSFKF